MSTVTPTPQEKALTRVLKISRFDGWSVIIVAALSILLTLALGDLLGSAIGLLAVVSGWMEVRGGRKLKARDPAGMRWLVRSQLLLLSVILAYCTSRLGSFDAETVMGNLTPDLEAILQESGIERTDVLPLVHTFFLALYLSVALVSVLYQGGMALYYRRKTPLVTAALTNDFVPRNP
jgi:Ca2+/Na+ antiporter